MRRHDLQQGVSLLFILLFLSGATVSATSVQNHMPLAPIGILYVGGSGPGNFTRIQDAIDNASAGDTVFVYDESSPYSEHVVVDISIRVIGEKKESTVIDGEQSLSVVTIKADEVTLSGFTIQHSGVLWVNSGIEVRSSHNTITGNIVTQNYNGISLYSSSDHNTIMGNTIRANTGDGLYLSDSSSNLLSENTISDNVGGIVLDQSSDNTVAANVFSNDGVVMIGLYQNTVMDNMVNGKPLVFLTDTSNMVVDEAGQVILVRCFNVTVQDCDLSNTSVGVYLVDSKNCRISNNTINSCRYGVILIQSDGNNISRNFISKNSLAGIVLNTCDYNSIMWNRITLNKFIGISLEYSQNNAISTNDIKYNGGVRRIQSGFGLRLLNSSSTRVTQNNFVLNAFNVYPVTSLFCNYDGNFWNRPRILPMLILGVKPWVQFDWHPALKPYDIP
jgi:parallel beta-helix repeat protein